MCGFSQYLSGNQKSRHNRGGSSSLEGGEVFVMR
jgi:hypothetical protein